MGVPLLEAEELLEKIEDTVKRWTINSSSFLQAQQRLTMTESSDPSIKLLLQQCMEIDLKKTIIYLDYKNLSKDYKDRGPNPLRTHTLRYIRNHITFLTAQGSYSRLKSYSLLKSIIYEPILDKVFNSYIKDRYPNPHNIPISYGEVQEFKTEEIFNGRSDYQATRLLASIIHIITNTIIGESNKLEVGSLSLTYKVNSGILVISDKGRKTYIASFCGTIHSFTECTGTTISRFISHLSEDNSECIIHENLDSFKLAYFALGDIRKIQDLRVFTIDRYRDNERLCTSLYKEVVSEIKRFKILTSQYVNNNIYRLNVLDYIGLFEYYMRRVSDILEYSSSMGYTKKINIGNILDIIYKSDYFGDLQKNNWYITNCNTSQFKRRFACERPLLNNRGLIVGFKNLTRDLVCNTEDGLNRIKERVYNGKIGHN